RHAALREQARSAAKEEAGRVREALELIAPHTGDENRLALKSIRDAGATAMGAAEGAAVLGPPHVVGEPQSLHVPRSPEAPAAGEAGWVAARAGDRELSLDVLFRLGAVDVDLLAILCRYVELAAEVLDESSAAAAEAIRQRAPSETSDLGVQVRAAATALLER